MAPAYIDSKGQLHDKAPFYHQALTFFQEFWLAILLFFSTLFNPTASRKLPQGNSMRDTRRRLKEEDEARRPSGGGGGGTSGAGPRNGGSGGGGGVGPTRRGGTMTLNDLGSGPVVGGCQSGSCR